MADPTRTIRILGNGLEAWLCAYVLSGSVANASLTIQIHPDGTAVREDGLYTILRPSALETLETFGIGLQDLLRLPSTLPSLGQVIQTANGDETIVPYGGRGIDWAGTGFHHHWLRARQAGLRHPYFAFSPGYHAIAGNRFAPPDRRNAIGSMQHESGLHVSAGELTEQLKQSLGDKVAVVSQSDASSEVDLLIHATGREDAVSASQRSHIGPVRPCAIRREEPDGSRLQIPLRTGWLDLATPAAPAARHQGSTPWREGALHVGRSAARLPGLEDRAMDRLLFELRTLLDLWPRATSQALPALEYNRLWSQEMDEWAALSALVSGLDNPRCSGRQALFRQRGYIEPLESQTICAEDWVDALIARHVVPAQYDRLSERLNDPQLKSELQTLSQAVLRTVREFPAFPAYLDAIDQALGRPPPSTTESTA
ncbi:tryptophan 7-halogenase [Maricaulis sp.]|uniref:tryptophan 7-halogenase n=1 Tax=Maricaulis sp. TaxID=1486257 RepID=UPI003A9151CA